MAKELAENNVVLAILGLTAVVAILGIVFMVKLA
jgi:hypothetical protein